MTIPKKRLIEFTNLVNECCAVMDHDYVADWLNYDFDPSTSFAFIGAASLLVAGVVLLAIKRIK